MITCHEVEGTKELPTLSVDHNHDGFVYLKQYRTSHPLPGDVQDWIVVDARMLDELIKALSEVQNKGYFLND